MSINQPLYMKINSILIGLLSAIYSLTIYILIWIARQQRQ